MTTLTQVRGEVVAFRVGPIHASVCAPADLCAPEVESAANFEMPTGIKSRWKVSDAPTFSGGEPNPCPCEIDPERRHWLLAC